QAEDGIRDATVTGVQTCALPISEIDEGNAARLRVQRDVLPANVLKPERWHRRARPHQRELTAAGLEHRRPAFLRMGRAQGGKKRSEERRVGKRESSRGSTTV